jgi:hypothetical protein
MSGGGPVNSDVRRFALMMCKRPKEIRMVGFASLIVQHFVQAVESSAVRFEPFPHLVVDELLPADIFRRVSDELPSFNDLASAPETGAASVSAYDRRATRAVEELYSHGSPSVWDDVGSGLKSNEVELALVRSFSPWIGGKIAQASRGPLRRQVRIHRDQAGFSLNPHTDAPAIFLTSFIYVSSGVPDPSLDTVLYEPLDPEARLRGLEGKEYAHEDPSDHRAVSRVVFRPNRMFSFLRTAFSLHGVGAVSDRAAPRHLISLRLKHAAQSA